MDINLIRNALGCKCPRCGSGSLYQPGFLNLKLRDHCPSCNLDLAKNDSADGPAVFLIFILGFLLVPLALLTDHFFQIPVWLHVLLWGVLGLGLIFALLKPLKAYIIALQWKHRPNDWK